MSSDPALSHFLLPVQLSLNPSIRFSARMPTGPDASRRTERLCTRTRWEPLMVHHWASDSRQRDRAPGHEANKPSCPGSTSRMNGRDWTRGVFRRSVPWSPGSMARNGCRGASLVAAGRWPRVVRSGFAPPSRPSAGRFLHAGPQRSGGPPAHDRPTAIPMPTGYQNRTAEQHCEV